MYDLDLNKFGYIYSISPMIFEYDENAKFIYIGSTTLPLATRFAFHISAYRRWQKTNLKYCSVNELFNKYGSDKCIIKMIEIVNISKMKEMEGYHVLNCNYVVNKYIPNRNKRQYYNDNKIKLLNYQNDYYQKKKLLKIS